MFSIRKFLGHDEKFFDLLEASAEQADSSVHHLVALLAKLEEHYFQVRDRRRRWIVWAWILTLPATALIEYILARAAAAF